MVLRIETAAANQEVQQPCGAISLDFVCTLCIYDCSQRARHLLSAINIIILPTPKRHDQPLSKPVCKRQTHQTSLKTDKKQNPNGKSHPRENLNTNLPIRYLWNFPLEIYFQHVASHTFAIPSLLLRYTFATTLLFVRFDTGGIAMMQQCAINTQGHRHRHNVNIFEHPNIQP